MNSTQILEGNGMDYVALTGWALFVISEVMPFLRKKESFNGLIHTGICLLRGSKCFIDGALEVVEKAAEEGKASEAAP